MKKLNPINSPAPEAPQEKKKSQQIGIAGFQDSITRYSSERELYNANSIRQHDVYTFPDLSHAEPDNLEHSIWEKLKKKKGGVLQLIGLGLKYLILAILYPIYFTLYLVPSKGLEYLKIGFKHVKKAIYSAETKTIAFFNSLRQRLPTRQRLAHLLGITKLLTAAKLLRNKLNQWEKAIIARTQKIFVPVGEHLNKFFHLIGNGFSAFGNKVDKGFENLQGLLERSFTKFQSVRRPNISMSFSVGTKVRDLMPTKKLWLSLKDNLLSGIRSLSKALSVFGNVLRHPIQSVKPLFQHIGKGIGKATTSLGNTIRKSQKAIDDGMESSFERIVIGLRNVRDRSRVLFVPVGKVMQPFAVAAVKSSEFVDSFGQKLLAPKQWTQSLSRFLSQAKDLVKSAPIRAQGRMVDAISKSTFRIALARRFKVIFTWTRLLPKYVLHLFDEVVAEMTQKKDKEG